MARDGIAITWSGLSDRVRPSWWGRLYGRWRERLMASASASEMIGVGLLVKYLLKRRSPEARLKDLVVACRRTSSPPMRRLLGRILRPWQQGAAAAVWRGHRIGWERYAEELRSPALITSLLLKAPGPGGEKGVLYCSFEYNWLRLLARPEAERFLANYFLVGASSWSPPDYAAMLSFAGLNRDPVFIGISNPADVGLYRVLAPTIRAVPIMASDWINPAFYAPREFGSRDIDILMVANFSPFKRHRLLFEALARMRRDLRVTLIGIPAPGRGERELRAEAKALGVTQDLEIVSNAPIETVTDYQCRAKTSVIFSLREGSCVAVTESLFAGSPVAMLRHAHVGSKAHINPQTGILVTEHRLDRQLGQFLESSASYRPQDWAATHITCHHASATLNGILRDHSREAGYPWTRDITPLCWRYVPSYVDPAEDARLAPEVERLRDEYEIELEKFQYRPH